MRGILFNYSTVNGHVPTETTDDKEKDVFLDSLETAYDISPRNYIKIAFCDFNAQLGKEAVYFPTAGKYSLHSLMDDNGSWLKQFAVSWNIIIGSTFYPHKDIHKSICRKPDGVTFNQKDHILIDK
jgi:hypothetical protein